MKKPSALITFSLSLMLFGICSMLISNGANAQDDRTRTIKQKYKENRVGVARERGVAKLGEVAREEAAEKVGVAEEADDLLLAVEDRDGRHRMRDERLGRLEEGRRLRNRRRNELDLGKEAHGIRAGRAAGRR